MKSLLLTGLNLIDFLITNEIVFICLWNLFIYFLYRSVFHYFLKSTSKEKRNISHKILTINEICIYRSYFVEKFVR